jgi:hypothetical protein
MPRSTRREQVRASFHTNPEANLERYRSVFITSVLILWAFQLTLDPTKPLDDMGFINGIHQPCSIEFNTRISETDLRRIIENHFEVA